MSIWGRLFTWERLLGWEFVGWTLAILVGTGLAMIMVFTGFNLATGAEACFAMAALVILAKITEIVVRASGHPLLERAIFTFVLFGVIGVGTVELIRWIEENRPKPNLGQPETSKGKQTIATTTVQSLHADVRQRIPNGMTLTPANRPIQITFKSSSALNDKVRHRIVQDLTRFRDYLVSLGIPAPVDLPPFGVRKADGGTGTGTSTPEGLPTYRGNLELGEKLVKDPTQATLLYCGYVMDKILLDAESPLQPAFGEAPHVSVINLGRAMLIGHGLTSYLNASFWNKRQPAPGGP